MNIWENANKNYERCIVNLMNCTNCNNSIQLIYELSEISVVLAVEEQIEREDGETKLMTECAAATDKHVSDDCLSDNSDDNSVVIISGQLAPAGLSKYRQLPTDSTRVHTRPVPCVCRTSSPR